MWITTTETKNERMVGRPNRLPIGCPSLAGVGFGETQNPPSVLGSLSSYEEVLERSAMISSHSTTDM